MTRVTINGVPYILDRVIAETVDNIIYVGSRDSLLTELVVVKRWRDQHDIDPLLNEHRVLSKLSESESQGFHHFGRLIPQLVTRGVMTSEDRLLNLGGTTQVLVYRWFSGFVDSLEDVLAENPRGISPRSMIWMWKRALELLGWIHKSGFAHNAVLPEHVLIHARDHGLTFCGWSRASQLKMKVSEYVIGRDFYYAGNERSAAAAGRDIGMLARVMFKLIGGDTQTMETPFETPQAIADMFAHIDLYFDQTDAWDVLTKVNNAAKAAYGPPAYTKFTTRSWEHLMKG